MTFYLKKQKDVIIDGNHNFNINNSYSVDNFRQISFGKATRKHDLKKLIGNGQKIIQSEFREPQEIKGSIKFSSNSENTFDENRRTFMRDWISTEEEIYLYRVENDRVTRRRIWIEIDGNEKYNYYPISEDIEIGIISEKPFFTNIVGISTPFVKTTAELVIPVLNNGEPTPFEVEFTLGANTSKILISTFANKSVEIDYSFVNSSKVLVELGDLKIYINDIERIAIDVTGSPFNLTSGLNDVTIISSAPGTGFIKYNERYL